MDWVKDPEAWVAFATLLVLEIVLGIDNIVFISILSGKLPQEQQKKARTTGLMLAIGTRVLLLTTLSFMVHLTKPLFHVFKHAVSGRDLILFAGGFFLLGKATREIHQKLEGDEGHASKKGRASFASIVAQILVLDIVFSLDSVITAVGMVDELGVMISAVIIATIVMIFTAGRVSDFVNRHPSVKILALSFLLLIGLTLIAEGAHQHIPKGYVYVAMGFSVFVELLNLRARKKAAQKPVHLRESIVPDEKPPQQPA